jgi:DNA-nicking Smr family endonuclease
MKDDNTFNTPFSRLKGVRLPSKKEKKEQKPPKPRQAHPRKVSKESEDESAIFARAMEGVMPLANDRVTPEPMDQATIVLQVRENLRKQDQEVVDTLHALVSGEARFDITCTGEYLEGHVIALDPRVIIKLKSGEFTIQAHLDLHGYVRESAKSALMNFIQNSHAMNLRNLLIIHGRGLKSDQGPVLKENVVKWLTTGTLSHLVLAFCSARPCDGGTGALYVLLKKRPGKTRWKRPL